MTQKTMNDGVHELALAIHWCVAAKNSLENVYGYSPNQLVFARNPNYPADTQITCLLRISLQ